MTAARPDHLVSVVMIFLDAQEFMDEAIRSVLAQRHAGVELLLCDDGSTDASTATARAWAARRPDAVRYLEHPGHAHRGMSATRNLGMAAATGSLVAFLDADDVWEPDHLSGHVALLASHPEAAMVCGRALDWRSWRPSPEKDSWSPLPWPHAAVVPPPGLLEAVLRRGAFSTPTCSLTVRSSALVDVGGAEDEFTGMFEDQALLAKLYLTQTAVMSGARTARYRRHDRSSTAEAERRGTYHPIAANPSREAYLRWLVQLLAASGRAVPPSLADAVDRELAPYAGRRPPARARVRRAARSVLPSWSGRLVRAVARPGRPGWVRMGSLRRLTPLSRQFGYDRGSPVDRYYIEGFLADSAHLITGRVLEVGSADYTERFGGDRVTRADVLNVAPGNPATTFVADLADAPGLPSGAFDAIVLTQTLHLVYDLPAAVATLHRILAPGGTLLLTVPGISPVSHDTWDDTWYWSMTPLAVDRLFSSVFGEENAEVSSYGNVLSSTAFLHGMAAEELSQGELDVPDPQFPLLVALRATRSRLSPPPREP